MSVTGSGIPEEFQQNLENFPLTSGDRVILAWSGGMDSTVLLYLLKFHSSLIPVPAYFNHHLRPESELKEELDLLEYISTEWDLPLQRGEVQPDKRWDRVSSKGLSLEEWARNLRYSFLESCAVEQKAKAILTAHHQDDWLETRIQRFFQGYSPLGLGDMRETHHLQVPVYRPLLSFTRERLKKAANSWSLRWSMDSSNQETQFLRNKIRKELLPQVEKLFPHFRKALEGSAERDRSLRESVQKRLDLMLPEGKTSISSDSFKSLDSYMRGEVLFRLMDQALKGSARGIRIPYRFIRDLAEEPVLRRFSKEGHGIRIYSQDSQLKVSPLGKKEDKPDLYRELSPGSWLDLEHFRVRIDLYPREGSLCPLPPSEAPWVIRSRKEGDSMGKPGRLKKRLSRYPQALRDQIPLLASGNRVVLILDQNPPDISTLSSEGRTQPGAYFSIEEKVIIS